MKNIICECGHGLEMHVNFGCCYGCGCKESPESLLFATVKGQSETIEKLREALSTSNVALILGDSHRAEAENKVAALVNSNRTLLAELAATYQSHTDGR